MAFDKQVIDLIFNAHADDAVCMLATMGAYGPNISPKGSMIVYDDQHLAYWERSKKLALEYLRADPRVAVMYSNKGKYRRGEIPFPGGILRFYGTAQIIERGELRDKIRTMLPEREINHEGAEEGFAVLIKLDRAEDMRGNSVM
jgi:hypothetical protein